MHPKRIQGDNVSPEKPTAKPPPPRVRVPMTMEPTEDPEFQEVSDREWLMSAIAKRQLWELERIRYRLGCLIPIGVVGLILLFVALTRINEVAWAIRSLRY